MMSRMLLSSSYVLVILVCFLQECSGRHLSSVHDPATDDKAKLLSHSAIKGLGRDPVTVHDVLDLKMTKNGRDRTNATNDDHQKQTDGRSMNKKDMIKDHKVKKFKELDHHHSKSTTFKVPLKHKQIHPQPGFNLDYSPPKTHPPSHN